MTNELSRLSAGELSDPHADELFRKLAELYDDPEVIEVVSSLRLKIVERLIAAAEEPQGVDMRSERGTFVYAGIKERLRKTRRDLSAINIEMIIGAVELLDGEGKTMIGHLAIPYDSQWARQQFINTNPLANVRQFTFTPYGADHWVHARDVTKDSPGAEFLLNDREAIAAQILMVVNAAMAYRNLAVSALEEDDIVPGLRQMKFSANKRDLIDALEYAVRLKHELRTTVVPEDPSVRMISGMSASARNLPPPETQLHLE